MSMIFSGSDFCYPCDSKEEEIKALKLKVKMLEKENNKLSEMLESKHQEDHDAGRNELRE